MRPDYQTVNRFTAIEVKQIYDSLPLHDRLQIDYLADRLCEVLPADKDTRAVIYFGKSSALELLMKLGAWMVQSGFEVEDMRTGCLVRPPYRGKDKRK